MGRFLNRKTATLAWVLLSLYHVHGHPPETLAAALLLALPLIPILYLPGSNRAV